MKQQPSIHAPVLVALLAAGTLVAAPPGEVTNLRWPNEELIAWDAAPGADAYIVYRGYVKDLGPDFFGTTYEAEVTTTGMIDAITPAPGWTFFYLTTGVNGEGEGTMGSGRDASGSATARPNNHAWPGYAVAGRWEGFRAWPSVAIHAAVLRTGKVLTWQGGNPTDTYVWDPATDGFVQRFAPADLFCAGHSFLRDGRLVAIGGTIFCCPPALGGIWSGLFDPVGLVWHEGPTMALGRWYPTGLTLGDGRVLALSGLTQKGEPNPLIEAYTMNVGPGGIGEWATLPGATAFLPLYPRTHLLSDGRVFLGGPGPDAYALDPVTEQWEYVASSQYGFRAEGSSVLLPPASDRVMIVGGRQSADLDPGHDGLSLATSTAEVIDLTQPAPGWSSTGSMLFERMHANLVILPTGKVLVVGGGHNDFATVYPSELYDPVSGTWSVMAALHTFRLYHSTAILLPDGRVMSAGSDYNPSAEFYSPGYLFRGPRPQIASAPAMVQYGQAFTVDTPDAANVQSVVFVRPGAVTHSFNMEQRLVDLTFVPEPGSLAVTAPSNADLATPGFYMLFLVDGDEVPSEAVFVQLR